MKADTKLTAEERVAWDGYAARAAAATMTCWFRWKQGCPVDYSRVIAESCAVADLLIEARRSR